MGVQVVRSFREIYEEQVRKAKDEGTFGDSYQDHLKCVEEASEIFEKRQRDFFFKSYPALGVNDYNIIQKFVVKGHYTGDNDYNVLFWQLAEFLNYNKAQIVKNAIRTQEFERGL